MVQGVERIAAGREARILAGHRALLRAIRRTETTCTAQQILNSLTEPALIINHTNQVSRINLAFKTVPDEDFIDIVFALAQPKIPDGEKQISIMEAAREHQRTEPGTQIPTESGNTYLVRVSPLQRKDSQIGTLIVMKDITKEIEARQKTHQERLEMERRLAEAEATSQAAEEQLLVTNHDLRNPMTVIHGQAQFARIALAKADLPMAMNSLTEIDIASNKALGVIGTLLNLNRQYERMNLQSLDINELINGALPERVKSLEDRGVEVINLIKPGEVRRGIADPEALLTVLDNLLDNAAGMMLLADSEKKEIAVWTEQSGDLIPVFVSDTGPGIPEDKIEWIFGKWNTTRRNEGGYGLGLGNCRKIMHMMGGGINVYASTIGMGSTFRFFVLEDKSIAIRKYIVDPQLPSAQ